VFLNLAAYNAALSGMNNMSLFFAGLILIVFAGMFHVYRYAMGQAKPVPPPPSGAKIRVTKSMIGSHKELPTDTNETSSNNPENVEAKEELIGKIEDKIKTTENPNGPQSDAPEIKANTADLDLKKDTNSGMSDLKKP
jgi:ubiquinol-cytochrome c reductase cytochrome b subunit